MAGQQKYPVELKERAVAMVRERERQLGGRRGATAQVARDLGVHKEALRHWVRQDGAGSPPSGVRVADSPADKDARIRELEQRNRELERANSILKAAASFFAREMDPPPPRW
jgi:transposase